jgi:hypothetical protein
MSPDEADDLPDQMWAAMVRHMQAEADSINRANAKLKSVGK